MYLDTSLLISAIAKERPTPRIQVWLASQDGSVISDWCLLEFASGVAAKHRAGELTSDARAGALQWIRDFSADTATILPISRRSFQRATGVINIGVKVRGADALHLAIAEEHGATLCTLDKEQAAAGEAMAVRTLLV